MNKLAALLAGVVLVLAGCSGTSEQKEAGDNALQEQQANNTSLSRMADSQPVPSYDWSQERQTLIDVLTFRAQGGSSTTMFYLNGIGLMWWCPSVGAPTPATSQLTASQQYVNIPAPGGGRNQVPMDQMEPTGAYIGDTTATWTVCLDDEGQKFGFMWEAPVASVMGTATGLPPSKRIKPEDVTFQFTDE